jgi:hypothetical protein
MLLGRFVALLLVLGSGAAENARAESPSAEAAVPPAPSAGVVSGKAPEIESFCAESTHFWARTRPGSSATYCSLVRRSRTLVPSALGAALQLAEQALVLQPHGSEARRAAAEIRLLSGDPGGAYQLLLPFSATAARSSSGKRLAAPSERELIVQARAALLSGNYQAALIAYRRAVLGLGELHRPHEEARVLVEAATAAAYASAHSGREARTYLSAAKAMNAPLLTHVVSAAWALSHYRDGEFEWSKGQVEYLQSSWTIHWLFERQPPAVGLPGEVLPVLPSGESSAFAAVVAEAVEVPAASIHWNEFVLRAGEALPEHLRRPGK